MKIQTHDFKLDVRVSMEAENEAEKHQLDAISEALKEAGADWGRWDDMNGRNGITIVVKKAAP